MYKISKDMSSKLSKMTSMMAVDLTEEQRRQPHLHLFLSQN